MQVSDYLIGGNWRTVRRPRSSLKLLQTKLMLRNGIQWKRHSHWRLLIGFRWRCVAWVCSQYGIETNEKWWSIKWCRWYQSIDTVTYDASGNFLLTKFDLLIDLATNLMMMMTYCLGRPTNALVIINGRMVFLIVTIIDDIWRFTYWVFWTWMDAWQQPWLTSKVVWCRIGLTGVASD